MGLGNLELGGKRWKISTSKFMGAKPGRVAHPLEYCVFTGIQDASEKPYVSKSREEAGQAVKNMIKNENFSKFLSWEGTLSAHSPASQARS